MKNIDKSKIINQLKSKIEQELAKAKEAFETTHGHATANELKAEGKYDTRGVEAGYLAGAQKVRVEELEQELELIEKIEFENPNKIVSVGSLVDIELNENTRTYFISSTSGGTILKINDTPILVISTFSPIGSAAIGLNEGDVFDVEINNDTREYLIHQIY